MFFSKYNYAGCHPAPIAPSAAPSGLSQVKQALPTIEDMLLRLVAHETHRSKPIHTSSTSIERRHLQPASTSNPPISAGPCLSRENPKHSQVGGVGTPDQMAKMRAKERRHNHANRTTARRHNHIPLASQLHHSREIGRAHV